MLPIPPLHPPTSSTATPSSKAQLLLPRRLSLPQSPTTSNLLPSTSPEGMQLPATTRRSLRSRQPKKFYDPISGKYVEQNASVYVEQNASVYLH